MYKKISLSLLCSIIGFLFVFAGYTKACAPLPYSSPIEPFEFTFVDLGFINWRLAPFMARILIGVEFFIGLLLLFNFNPRKISYKLGIGILVFFSGYLLVLLAMKGNVGNNCGCFGSYFKMSPLQALLKNLIMLAVLFVLYKYHSGWDLKNKSKYLMVVLFLTSFAMPFIWNPVELNYSEAYLNRPEENFKIELDTLYNNAELTIPPRSLSQGKQVIAFLSLTCSHCRTAAKKIRIMHERNPEIPFYFVLDGKDDEPLKKFFDDTHTENISHCALSDRSFVYLAGTVVPTIYLVNNSVVEHDLDYMILDQTEVEKWLAK